MVYFTRLCIDFFGYAEQILNQLCQMLLSSKICRKQFIIDRGNKNKGYFWSTVYKLSANLKVSRPIPLTNTFYVIHAAGVNSNLVLSPLLSDSRVCEHQAAPANYDRYSK